MTRLLLVIFILAGALQAQFGTPGIPYWRVRGVGVDASRPATCTARRDVYVCVGAGCTPDPKLQYCTATNTWSDLTGSGSGDGVPSCADAGGSDTYSCDPTIASYDTGSPYLFKANTANTGAATINLSGLGAKTIKKPVGGITTDLDTNDIRAGQWVLMTYDGTNMQMQSMLGNAGGADGNGSVWLETETASSSATLDFSCPSASYDIFVFKLVNVVPATDGANLLMQFSTDGGSTFDTASNYNYSAYVTRAGGASVGGTEAMTDAINLTHWNIENTTDRGGASGSFEVYNPAGSAHWKTVSGDSNFQDNAGFRLKVDVRGSYEVTTSITDVRFKMHTGNIASGKIICYGLAQ